MLEHAEGNGVPGVTEEFESWYQRSQSFNEGYGHSDKNEVLSRAVMQVKDERVLSEYLKEQLNVGKYSSKEWELMDFLIMNLDDDGMYTMSVEATAASARADKNMVKKCLEDLQQLEPIGIFAENLEECLLRQLDVLGVEDENLERIIRVHLKDASQGKISEITRDLQISSVQARKYIAFIGTLNPKPLSGFWSGSNAYVIPDILFTRKGDEWDITLNDNWIGNYHLNEYYLKMICESHDEEIQNYFKEKLERARFILNSIEQRRNTILSISRAVLEWQSMFFKEQKELVPMTMTDVAEKLGIHASTVSRAVNGKYIQYPGGCVLMKELFLASASGDSKESGVTAVQIKKMMKEYIDSEDKQNPYSDQILMNLLNEKGISVSRRVIAKYRNEMGIQGRFQRKEV